MAHPHHTLIRYVQRALEEQTGVRVSYNWVLTEVDKTYREATQIARFERRDIREVLLWLIKPTKRSNADHHARSTATSQERS